MRHTTVLRAIAFMVLAALPVTFATPAGASTKVREQVPLSQDAVIEGLCDFPVVVNDQGGPVVQVTTLDASGNPTRIDIHVQGLVLTTFTNPETGESVTYNNSGPLTVIFNEDGSVTVIQRGQSWSGDQGLLTGDAFFVHFTGLLVTVALFNEETGFFDFVSQTRAGTGTDICAQLAP